MNGTLLPTFTRQASIGRAFSESMLLLGLLAPSLVSLHTHILASLLYQGLALFIYPVCTFWYALRLRQQTSDYVSATALETGAAAMLILGMSGLKLALGALLPTTVSQEDILRWSIISAISIALVYTLTRSGLRVWQWWNQLRQQRLVWALTHAQLVVATPFVLMWMVATTITFAQLNVLPRFFPDQASFTLPDVVQVFIMLLPQLIITATTAALILAALCLLLFPISYLVARRTTCRLEQLATATTALRRGAYDTRIPVTSQDEVAQLQTNFNAMAAELEDTLAELQHERNRVAGLLQTQRSLTASVSHELRTPLATIHSYLEAATNHSEQPSLPDLRHDLDVIQRESTRLQRLIDDLFTLAQTESGQLSLRLQPTDIGPLVQHVVATFAPLAWQAGRIEMVAQLKPDLPPILADADRLEQILVNLVRNSMRHTPPGGIIAVAGVATDDMVQITVRDTGTGIPPEILPHIWERFYRVSGDPPSADPGSGLGLALVKDLTEAMGGSVAVTSTVGVGSCFTVQWPRTDATPSCDSFATHSR